MTTESALSKLSFLLGEVDSGVISLEEARARISKPLRGELTSPVSVKQFSFRDGNFVEALVQSMDKIISKDTQGSHARSDISSALFSLVVSFGDLASIEALLRAGANVDALDGDGRSALHVVAASKERNEVLRFLVDVAHANVNLIDQSTAPRLARAGLTPLDIAMLSGNIEAVEFLRARGAKQAFELLH